MSVNKYNSISGELERIDGIVPVDATPTSGSTNPVQSGGVYTSLSGKANTSDLASYLPLSGGTLTGTLIQTTGYLKGEDINDTNHAIKLGHNSDNVLNFYECGGAFNFYKSVNGTNTLLFGMSSSSVSGNLVDTTPTSNSAHIVTSGGVYTALANSFRLIKSVTYPYSSSNAKGWIKVFDFDCPGVNIAILSINATQYSNSSAILCLTNRYSQDSNKGPEVTLLGNVTYANNEGTQAGGYLKYRIAKQSATASKASLEIYIEQGQGPYTITLLYSDASNYTMYDSMTYSTYTESSNFIWREVTRRYGDSIETTGVMRAARGLAVGSGIASGLYSQANGYMDSSGKIYYPTASGTGSTAFGSGKASGQYSIAAGYNTAASGAHSFALGNTTNATGNWSVSIGSSTTAGGGSSFAAGIFSSASGQGAVAIGHYTNAVGKCSFTAGDHTQADGKASHTEGSWTRTTGKYSHAGGYKAYASGGGSFAHGYLDSSSGGADTDNLSYDRLCAEGKGSFVLGFHRKGYRLASTGDGSFAMGYIATMSSAYSPTYKDQGIVASGAGSLAGGYAEIGSSGRLITATANGSFTWGIGTQANADGQAVFGKYNATDSNAIFQVGIGTAGNATKTGLAVYSTKVETIVPVRIFHSTINTSAVDNTDSIPVNLALSTNTTHGSSAQGGCIALNPNDNYTGTKKSMYIDNFDGKMRLYQMASSWNILYIDHTNKAISGGYSYIGGSGSFSSLSLTTPLDVGSGGTGNTSGKATCVDFPRNAVDYNTAMSGGPSQATRFDELSGVTGVPSHISTFTNPWFNLITMHSVDANYGSQLAIPMTGFTSPAWRYYSGGSFGSWYYIPTASSNSKGSTTTPVYISNGLFTNCSTYAGGTKVTLNGSNKGASTASFYAPTTAGTSGYYLKSNGSGAPTWAAISGGGGDYLPLSGGQMTGQIRTPGTDIAAIEPKKANYDTIGSSSYYFYRSYISTMHTNQILGLPSSSCGSSVSEGTLGSSSSRWGHIYTRYSVDVSSDKRLKYDISYIGDSEGFNETLWSDKEVEDFVDSLKPCVYKLVYSDNDARPHHGFIAQDVGETLSLLNRDHSVYNKSPLTIPVPVERVDYETGETETIIEETVPENPDYNYSLCYDEFIPDLVRYCQILKTKVITLEERLAKLEDSL